MKKLAGALLLLSLTACGDKTPTTDTAAPTDACSVSSDYQINFQRMDETLQQIGHGSGCFIEADIKAIGALHPNPVQGHFTVKQAVDKAIAGSGLQAQLTEHNSIKVMKN